MHIKMKENIVINNITHQQIEIQIQDELLRLLDSIPVLSNIDVRSSWSGKYDIAARADINFNEKLNIICEVKSKAEPQYVRKTIDNIIRQKMIIGKEKDSEYYFMIAAPYISETSGKICEENGIGYIDLSGNCMLKYRSLYIRVEGKPNKYSERRGSKSIFERSSVRSSIILRLLLQNPNKQWKIQELANASGSSVGQISKVKKFLEEKEYIITGKNGFFIDKPKKIIAEWAKVYNSKPNTIYECYSLDSSSQIEKKLIEMKNNSGIECILTGFSGAVRYSPSVRYNKVHIYSSLQDFQEVLENLDCKKVTSGANLSIIIPYDPCVLMDSRNINDSMVASPVQVCLDLLGLKGRGEEAAAAVLEKEFSDNER